MTRTAFRFHLIVLSLAAGLSSPAFAARCNTLGMSCGWTSCTVGCGATAEGELRAAVALANSCAISNPAARTVGFETCSVITLNQTSGAVASCPDKSYSQKAICLTGNDITINGAYAGGRVTFKYATPSECDPDAEGGAALFVLKGNRGTVTNFTMQYFPEGIHILSGSQNHIVDVDSDRICDDAFSVEGGTDAEISQADLTGGQCGCPSPTGTECTGGACSTNLCGRDKSIQINGGTGTVIRNSRFTKVGQPFLVNNVAPMSTTVDFRCNDVVGEAPGGSCNPDDRCQSLHVRSGTATVRSNRIQYCKFGTRVQGRGQVQASDNVVKDAYVSAFNVSCLDQNPTNLGKCNVCQGGTADGQSCTPPGTGCMNAGGGTCVAVQPKLKGERNWMKNYAFETSTTDCPKAALVFRSNDGASPKGLIDFGGGDCRSIVGAGKTCNTSPMQPIAPGWTASAGGNVFCDGDSTQAGEDVHMSGWNATESGCVDSTPPDTQFACNSDRPVSLCGSTFNVAADWIGQMYISASGLCPTDPTTACANEPNPLAAPLCTN